MAHMPPSPRPMSPPSPMCEDGEESPGPSREPSTPPSPLGTVMTEGLSWDPTANPDVPQVVPKFDFPPPVSSSTTPDAPLGRPSSSSGLPRGLRPFAQQVGGRHVMLTSLDGCLYKEADEKEVAFYQTIAAAPEPHPLRPFLPLFHGVAEVRGADLIQILPPTSSCAACITTPFGPCPGCTLAHQVLRRFRPDPHAVYRFLAVRDVTRSLSKPCVADLKMGRRQYGYGASAAKVRSKELKAARSTSRNLFFRIVGLRGYDSASDRFFQLRKAQAAGLDKARAPAALAAFLADGERGLRRAACAQILDRLRALERALRAVDGWHFITSSLLLVYDGDPQRPPRGDIVMVDFAHTEPVVARPDAEYRYGLANLIDLLECLQADRPYHPPATPRGSPISAALSAYA